MACRLLCRCARLACRPSSYTPASGGVRIALAGAEAPEVPGAQAPRRMCESTAAAKGNLFMNRPTRTELDECLEKASTPQDILSAWAKYRGSGNQAASAFIQYFQKTQKKGKWDDEQKKMLEDPCIVDMMKTCYQQLPRVWNTNLVTMLLTLWFIDVPQHHSLLASIQTEVLWRARKLTYKQLSRLVEVGGSRKTAKDAMVVNTALKQLELRWTEITDPVTVSRLINKGEFIGPGLMDKLEDKALELAEHFSAEEIRMVCKSFASQNRRSVPLLRALSHHLLQKPSSELTIPVIVDMCYVYGKLGFNHPQIFQRLASDLLPTVPQLNSTQVTRCAKSLGLLKWLHMTLFEAFAEHYIENSDNYSIFQLCNLLLTFARLGFQPIKGEQFFKKVHAALDESFSSLQPPLQTDVAWSLCVLQQAKPQHLIPLTKSDFVENLTAVDRARNYELKLRHIATTLHLELADSSSAASVLSVLPLPADASPPSDLRLNLREALQALVNGREETLRVGVDTVYGWTIEGEMVVDCDNKPIVLSKLKAPHLPGGGGNLDLPEGARRLAFVAWEFPNFGSKSRELLGRFMMMKRHLQLAGFIPVEVPFYEWLELKTTWQKQAYLKDKLSKAVGEDMAK